MDGRAQLQVPDDVAEAALAASLAEIDAGEVPAGSDLPSAIGKPATGALLGAGLSTLDQIAERSEAQLLSLHGVGPKAVRILTAALAEQGRGLAQAAHPAPR